MPQVPSALASSFPCATSGFGQVRLQQRPATEFQRPVVGVPGVPGPQGAKEFPKSSAPKCQGRHHQRSRQRTSCRALEAQRATIVRERDFVFEPALAARFLVRSWFFQWAAVARGKWMKAATQSSVVGWKSSREWCHDLHSCFQEVRQHFHLLHVSRSNQVNKKFIAAALGNWLEWYDFGVYAALADLLGKHFFPDHDASVQVMQSFLAFAAGYISRPVGGILIGVIADRLGRKCALWLDVNMALIYWFGIDLACPLLSFWSGGPPSC